MRDKDQKIQKIDTLILSDIHLGFGLSRPERLIEELEMYKFKRLILNGDIFHGLNFKRLNRHHWRILSKVRKLSTECEVVWINGNHDGAAYILSHLIGVKVLNKYVWKYGKKKYLAIHGHQFDRFLHKNVIISSIAIFLYNLVQKIDTENEIISRWIQKRSTSWLRLSDEVALKAIKYAKKKNVDVIFCGHTHIARQLELEGIKYYNSGCWTAVPSSYITIAKEEISILEAD